jgi:hypothetical protein
MNLKYNVPYLGKVNARLFDESVNCYSLLDSCGHIERMKSIDQLGVIRGACEGAHHSRWEYVMVQLSLIHQLCTLKDENTGRNVANGLGLQSRTEFLERSISGASIIQMWILLFNSGHLPGTFSSERGLLEYCKDNSSFKRIFRAGLPEGYIRVFFDDVLENEEIYNFHKLLIYFHLNRYRRIQQYDTGSSKFVDFLLSVLNYYFEPHENLERQENLKKIFERIRQLSYLFLDSQYASFPLNFDLSKIFLNFQDYVDELFKLKNSSIIRTLNSFEDLLSINMYHASKPISGLGVHEEHVKGLIHEEGVNSIRDLQKLLMNRKDILDPDFRLIYDKRDIIHLLFEINYSFPVINEYIMKKFRQNLSYESEQKLNSNYGKSNCILTFQSANLSNHVAIALTMRNHLLKRNMVVVGKFLKDMINLNFNIKDKENTFIKNLIDEIFQNPYEKLFLSILEYISSNDIFFEFKAEEIGKSILPTKRGLKNMSKEIDDILKNSGLNNQRFQEIKALENSITDLNHRSGILTSLSSIDVYDHNRDSITDIDGCALGFKDGKLGILLVEAKNLTRRSFSIAETQLRDRMEKIGFKTSAEINFTRLSGDWGRCVYCYLPIDGDME